MSSPLLQTRIETCSVAECSDEHLISAKHNHPAHIIEAWCSWSSKGWNYELDEVPRAWSMSYTVRLPGREQGHITVPYREGIMESGTARVAVIDFAARDGVLSFDGWSIVIAMEVDGAWQMSLGTKRSMSVKVVF